jgi:hypothetical protein
VRVMRSHFLHLRRLLAIAMIAIVAMAVAIVILTTVGTSAPASPHPLGASGSVRYDGGPEEGTAGPFASPDVTTARPDGGPDEGVADRAVSGSK